MFRRTEYRRYGIPSRRRLLPSLAFAIIDGVAMIKNSFDRWRARRG
jgi:hypothetical protein